MNLKFSEHKSKHIQETWNQVSIKREFDAHRITDERFIQGETSDVMYGYTQSGACVGLIVSKRKSDGSRVIITGFEAPEEYWKSV